MGLQNSTASCSRVGPAQAGSSGRFFQWHPVTSQRRPGCPCSSAGLSLEQAEQMWHHHSPDETQVKCGGQETPRGYKKSESQSIWAHKEPAAFPAGCCLAQPLLYLPSPPAGRSRICRGHSPLLGDLATGTATASVGNEPACPGLSSSSQRCLQEGTRPHSPARGTAAPSMFAKVRFGGRWGKPRPCLTLRPARATLITPTGGRGGHSTRCTAAFCTSPA